MRSADREPGDAESERRRPTRDKGAPERAASRKRVARSKDEAAPAPRRSVARRSPVEEEREPPGRRLKKRRALSERDTRVEDDDHAARADDQDEPRPRRASSRTPREGQEGDKRKSRRTPEHAPIKPLQAAAAAASQLRALTGREPEGIVSAERVDTGWRIGIEVLETRRIPDSTDILALYQVEVDDEGEMTSYRRERRYYRGRAEES
ncbi:gas vesicle protein GvpO [Embleya sp. NPDC005575]|uniref:gas vesicle protein GvpO n=1 Tax=Embleya sp. NPDC005575 TaxID=3156892 RepID=UPI0033AC61E1